METKPTQPTRLRPNSEGPTRMISTRLPVSDIELAKRIAKHDNATMAHVIRCGIREQAKRIGIKQS